MTTSSSRRAARAWWRCGSVIEGQTLSVWLLALMSLIVSLAVPVPQAAAELPEPLLTVIAPPGGRQGESVEVVLAGEDLDEATALMFSHPGISAVPVMAAATEFDPEPKPLAGKLTVTIAADVPPGIYEAAAVGRFGVSSPRRFMVGRSPEFLKAGPIHAADTAMPVPLDTVVNATADANAADHYAVECQAGQRVHVELWANRIDSRIDPLVEIRGPDGRLVEVAVDARHGDPALDWTPVVSGRHVVRVHDRYARGGGEFFYRLGLSTGPVVVAVFPAAAEPGQASTITVMGRGLGEGAVPMPDDDGRGLEQREINIDPSQIGFDDPATPQGRLLAPRDATADLVPLRGGLFDELPSPPTVLQVDLDVVPEVEPNDTEDQPQLVPKPAAIAGRFHPRGDRDCFAFEAAAGEVISLDLFARRLGSESDAALKVERLAFDENGGVTAHEVAFADDGPQEFQGAMVDRPSLDPQITFTAETSTTYRVTVKDLAVDSVASPAASYVLAIRPPAPNFEMLALVARPDRGDANKLTLSSPSLAAGGTVAVDVLVVRQDGFAGDVTVTAEDLPEGVTAVPVVIAGGSRRGVIVLQAADDAKPIEQEIRLLGRATVGDAEVVKVASAATLRWKVPNANEPQLVRQSDTVRVAVTADAAPVTLRPQQATTWETARGGKLSIPIDVIRRPGVKGPLSLTPLAYPAEMKLPDALKVPEVKFEEPQLAEGETTPPPATGSVAVDVEPGVAPGTYTVALQGVAKYAFSRNPEAAARAKADLERMTATAQQRSQVVETSKAALAAAEKVVADAQAAGGEPPAEMVAARDAAQQAVDEAEASFKAAEEERGRREKAATDAAAASAAKDIDVPVLLPPITVVVADAPVSMSTNADDAAVAAGAGGELKIAVERKYGFAGPVTIEAVAASPVEGLGLAVATVAAEESEAVVAVTTTEATPPGTHTVTLKGKVSFHDREVAFERQVPLIVSARAQESPQP
ncbi:MAG: hypothetical protein ACO3NZ_03380 [Pirellulales bacterium]